MFWKKKRPALPQVTERELEIVNSVIRSMEKYPNSWSVTSNSFGKGMLIYREAGDSSLHDDDGNVITYVVSDYSPKLTFNAAEIDLITLSKERLNRAGQELMQEKLILSLARNEESV